MGNCLTVSSNSSTPRIFAATTSLPTSSASQPSASTGPILPFLTSLSNQDAMYTLGSELGRGQTGIIRTCTSRSSGALYACKSLSKHRLCSARDVEDVVREVHIMKQLSRSLTTESSSQDGLIPGSVVRLHDVIEDKESIHLVMELCKGGELYDRIVKKKCYPEAQAAYIIKSLLEIVQFCHSKGVMHRDIKPENILLVEDSDMSPIKLADFGLALEFSPGQKFTGIAGSTYYIAPEVLQGKYSEEVDMWGVGVVMYLLLSGTPPFCGVTEQRIFNAIQTGVLKFPSNPWDKISPSAKDLIAQLLHSNAKLRLTPSQALNHPWILHHSKVPERNPSNAMPTTLSIPKHMEKLGSHKLTVAAAPYQACAREERSNLATPGLQRTLMDIIVNKDEKNTRTVSNSINGQKTHKSGWTCTVLSLNGNEETLVVDMGHEKYLIFHDKIKKKIGWKLLPHATVSQQLSDQWV